MTAEATGELPERVRVWASAYAAQPIVELTPMGGGITHTKWLLRLADGDRLVLRWSDPEVWGAVGREHVAREVLACRLLADAALPVPQLLAGDPSGADAGGPASLLTWRPGRTRLDPLGPVAIDSLARLAVAVHRQSLASDQRPPTFAFRGPEEPVVPDWTGRPRLWQRAIDLRVAGPPPTPSGLLHRDFHLGNVLWDGDQVSGLVDWAETSWGPPDLDVAHLCSDLAMLHSIPDVEAWRAAYVRRGGRLDQDPDARRFWVVSDILGFLPDPEHVLPAFAGSRPDMTVERIRCGLEDLLGWALG